MLRLHNINDLALSNIKKEDKAMNKEYGLFTEKDVQAIEATQVHTEFVEDVASAWAAAIPAAAAAGN